MKKLISALFIFCYLFVYTVPATASEINVLVNGKKLEFDNPPIVRDGNTLVPVRGIFEALSAQVEWDQGTQTVVAQKGETVIWIQLGDNVATLNGTPIQLQAPATMYHDSVYVPLRFISESLGANVGWNPQTSSITIEYDIPFQESTNTQLQALTVQEVAKQSSALVLIKVYNEYDTLIGTGSGFLVSPKGRVITNYHVIDSADYIEAVTADNTTFEVSGVLAYNVKKDIAVLQLKEANALPFVVLGDSEKVELGENVVAIGSPLALQNTVSNGIISGFRESQGNKYLQTSAPISPGSSGGALFNMFGQVIGITVATYEEGQNLNLAIPINEVKYLLVSNETKTLAQVKDEVYPPAEKQDFIDRLENKYKTVKVNGSWLTFDEFQIYQSASINEVFVYCYVSTDSLKHIINADKNGDQKEVEKWLNAVARETLESYEGSEVFVSVILYEEFDQCPSQLPPADLHYDVYYNSETKKWEVSSRLIIGYFNSDEFETEWFPWY